MRKYNEYHYNSKEDVDAIWRPFWKNECTNQCDLKKRINKENLVFFKTNCFSLCFLAFYLNIMLDNIPKLIDLPPMQRHVECCSCLETI